MNKWWLIISIEIAVIIISMFLGIELEEENSKTRADETCFATVFMFNLITAIIYLFFEFIAILGGH